MLPYAHFKKEGADIQNLRNIVQMTQQHCQEQDKYSLDFTTSDSHD